MQDGGGQPSAKHETPHCWGWYTWPTGQIIGTHLPGLHGRPSGHLVDKQDWEHCPGW